MDHILGVMYTSLLLKGYMADWNVAFDYFFSFVFFSFLLFSFVFFLTNNGFGVFTMVKGGGIVQIKKKKEIKAEQ